MLKKRIKKVLESAFICAYPLCAIVANLKDNSYPQPQKPRIGII